MRTNSRGLATVACLALALTACKDTSTTPSGTSNGGTISVVPSAYTVVADGTTQVRLNITNTTGQTVTVQTDRGTFVGGGTSTTVSGGTATADLVTCDATVTGCVGTAHVSATAGFVVGATSITFSALGTLCASDCTVDARCPTLTCVATSGTGTCSSTVPSSCVVSSGGDTGGGGTLTAGTVVTVTPSRTRMPPDGASQTDVVVGVTTDGAATSGVAVTIATTAGTLSAATGTTGADGKVTVKLTAPASVGVATITASTTAAPVATGTATVTFPRLGALALADPSSQYEVMGVKGSGWQELGFLHVQALDETGAPYPDGLAVRFEHRRLGGSTLSQPLTADTATCLAASGCIGFETATGSGADAPDSDGLAATWIYSGTVAGTLSVTASASVGGVTRTINLPTVAVVGAKANGGDFTVVCGPRNVPALAETDCGVSWVDAPFTCMALLKDRYGNLLGRSTQVIFASEVAGVGPIATTPAYDPGTDAVSQATLGSATQIFNTLGAGLPLDVAPAAGEPWTYHGFDGCGARTHNPRDGVVTVVAVADGEEAFYDANGNGVHDATEPFVDQGEPFVDADDDGARDAGEWFLDVDGDGAYDPPNGKWDADTKIWTQTLVVYTGVPAQVGEFTTPAAPVATGDLLGTRWAAGAAAPCTATAPDPGFSVTPAVTGPPAIPAVTQNHYVYASDWNLNMLSAGTGYSVSTVSGSASATYFGLAKYADQLGFFYRYWPCDDVAGGACASQCEATGSATHCLMTPSISAYSCGIGATVLIEPGSEPGTSVLGFDVSTPFEVYTTGRTALDRELLSGTVN